MGGVRVAEDVDLHRVADLWRAILDHHGMIDPAFVPRPGADREIEILVRSQQADPDACVFVWEDSGEVTGFCCVRVDHAAPIREETERAEITDLFVRLAERRQGAGRALVKAATRWAAQRGIGRLEVRVLSANREGQEFWRALGYDDFVDVLQRRL